MGNCDRLAIHDLRLKGMADQAEARRQADLKERETVLRERTVTRQLRALEPAEDAPAEGLTLDALTAVFDEEVDLTPTLAVLERVDGGMVLPACKLNWVYGLPGSGKSFFSEIAMIEAVLRGGRAFYLDYEDSKKTFHQRAAILGFNPNAYADSFKYIHGGIADYPKAQADALREEAIAWLLDAPDPAMNQVIIDAAESSGCPSDGSPVNDWLKEVVFPWRDPIVNAGVLVVDHIPKTKDNRPDGPIGSQRKLAATDGINLLVGGYCWSKKKGGRITLTNDKDRTGDYGKKETVATIIGEWKGQGDARSFSHRIVEPSHEDSTNNNIGGAILEAVAAAGPEGFKGKSKLQQAVGSNRNVVFATIDNLMDGGLLSATKVGQTDIYKLTADGLEYVD